MGTWSMEQLIAAGAFVGGLFYAFWNASRGSQKAVQPISQKQDQTLTTINLTLEAVGRVQEKVDEIGDDHKLLRSDVDGIKTSQKEQGQRIGEVATGLAKLEGRVDTIEKLHEARGCLAPIANAPRKPETTDGAGRAVERELQPGGDLRHPPRSGR